MKYLLDLEIGVDESLSEKEVDVLLGAIQSVIEIHVNWNLNILNMEMSKVHELEVVSA